MTMSKPPLDILPEPGLLIGDERLATASGGSQEHR